MSLLAIRNLAAATRPDLPFDAVLEYLIRNWTGPDTEYRAYEMLKTVNQLGLYELHATLLLFDGPPLHVLRHQWTIEGQSGQLHVPDHDLKRVMSDKHYLHLPTGEVVPHAARKLAMMYFPGSALSQVIAHCGPQEALRDMNALCY